jgi:hypothetical protein
LCRSTIEADETARPNNALQTLLQGWREARREHTAAAGISGVSASTSTVHAGAHPRVVNSATNGSNGSGTANMGSIRKGSELARRATPTAFHANSAVPIPLKNDEEDGAMQSAECLRCSSPNICFKAATSLPAH